MTVLKPTRRTYPLDSTTGISEPAATNNVSQAHQDTRRARASRVPTQPERATRRSSARATHSSRPTAGPAAGSDGSGVGGSDSLISHLADVHSPEEPLRTEDHERDQDRENDQIRPRRRPVAGRVRLGATQQ